MKTTKVDTSMLNEPMFWNVYSQYYCSFRTPIEGSKTPDGYAHKNCYDGTARVRFTRPSYDCFYMRVLRQLLKNGAQSAWDLGCKTKVNSKIVRHNTSILTAMRRAGMIEYDKKGKSWFLTSIGATYYEAAEHALKDALKMTK